MMKSSLIFACLAASVLCLTMDAQAQGRRNVRPPISKYQPYTSPYLSLFGPGGADFGYFTQTLPQEQFRQSQYNFNRDFSDFTNKVNRSFETMQHEQQSGGVQRTIGTTGHPVSFMNYGTYYPAKR